MFTLALLAVFAPVGFPSTLSCHVAVKPTICDMLLSHAMKNLELIHCYQHVANPTNIRWARWHTQVLCVASFVCLLSLPFPPTSLEKVLRIR